MYDEGTRVYYRENGKDDRGTVVEDTGTGVVVRWDTEMAGEPEEYEYREVRKL
ncbi:hypothetical protein AB0I72_26665 [Nocardiopsis sp. NPDC049922]|uniref:hypothetical protein n=1 Tax=Nocardiopsis sp. NPDC049922 TaxID=3155157 RepID=UPI0033DE2078